MLRLEAMKARDDKGKGFAIDSSNDDDDWGDDELLYDGNFDQVKRASFCANGPCLSIMDCCNSNYSCSGLEMCSLWLCIGTTIIRRVMDDTLHNQIYYNVLSNMLGCPINYLVM